MLILEVGAEPKSATNAAQYIYKYKCDAEGVKMGLSNKPFKVEYIYTKENDKTVAIIPIADKSITFSMVSSAP
jgi:hypothetical protein